MFEVFFNKILVQVAKIFFALSLSSLAGAILIGILIGFPSEIVSTTKTHFIVVVPFSILIGMPSYFFLRLLHIKISFKIILAVGISVSAIPAIYLFFPEINNYGITLFLTETASVFYLVSLLLGTIFGALIFKVLLELWRLDNSHI